MYAIVETGGKQYRVEENSTLKVEKLNLDLGSKFKLDALMINQDGNLTVGNPTIKGAYVEAEVTYNGKAKKINVFKYKAKKNQRKRKGHRQPYSEIKITKIVNK